MKLEQLKIFPEDHAWFTDEQNKLKRTTGEKPTQAELFQKLKATYEAMNADLLAIMSSEREDLKRDAAKHLRIIALRLESQERDAARETSSKVRAAR